MWNKIKRWYRIATNWLSKPVDVKPLPGIPGSFDVARPNDPLWLRVAFSEVGQEEIIGRKHNKRIVEYHSQTTLKATTDEVYWCASFVCWVLHTAGLTSTRSAAARSFLNWGDKINTPKRGCVVIFKRPPSPTSGHVGFYLSEDQKDIYVLGGNQDNKVNVKKYSKNNLLGYRWPKE